MTATAGCEPCRELRGAPRRGRGGAEESFGSGSLGQPLCAERALSEIIGDVCGGSQISNDDELKSICQAVVNDKPEEVALLRSGKNKLMSALVGEVMKRTQGRANRFFAALDPLLAPF